MIDLVEAMNRLLNPFNIQATIQSSTQIKVKHKDFIEVLYVETPKKEMAYYLAREMLLDFLINLTKKAK